MCHSLCIVIGFLKVNSHKYRLLTRYLPCPKLFPTSFPCPNSYFLHLIALIHLSWSFLCLQYCIRSVIDGFSGFLDHLTGRLFCVINAKANMSIIHCGAGKTVRLSGGRERSEFPAGCCARRASRFPGSLAVCALECLLLGDFTTDACNLWRPMSVQMFPVWRVMQIVSVHGNSNTFGPVENKSLLRQL